MRVFPQLGSNATSQFPIAITRHQRTVMNRTSDGGVVLYSDTGGRGKSWRVELQGLDETEREAVEEFFQSVEGRLLTFTYLDPFANLLQRSEDFGNPVWVKGPSLSVVSGWADPSGGTGAALISNPAPVAQTIVQARNVPAWFVYAASLYLKAAAPTEVSLALTATGGSAAKQVTAGAEWKRVELAGSPGSPDESVTFELAIPSGAEVMVFGAQLEAQPAPSQYRRSMDTSGVYEQARFLQDEIVWRTTDTNVNHTTLRIASR
ncbi:MAG: hypothetical protein SFV51_08905 [Bryobacteraceae bacterium]|nr:hypothetical protein [Bryobacteraceae bacterium]